MLELLFLSDYVVAFGDFHLLSLCLSCYELVLCCGNVVLITGLVWLCGVCIVLVFLLDCCTFFLYLTFPCLLIIIFIYLSFSHTHTHISHKQ